MKKKLKRFVYQTFKKNQYLLRQSRKVLKFFREVGKVVGGKREFLLPYENSVTASEWVAGKKGENLAFHEVYPKRSFKRKLPIPFEGQEIHERFRSRTDYELPAQFTAKLSRVRVVGEGNIIAENGTLLRDFSQKIWRGRVVKQPQFPKEFGYGLKKQKYLNGKSLSLACYACRGFYHWMVEMLPRLHLVEKAGYRVEDFDHVIVGECLAPFHYDSLKAFGVRESQIVVAGANTDLLAESLVIPSLITECENIPDWLQRYMREKFLGKEAAKQVAGSRIYISRRGATHRRIANEDEIVPILEKHGFQVVCLEDLNLDEQVNLFAGAEAVISPHGAGLVHLVFCRTKARIMEILHPSAMNLFFWSLADSADLSYHYIFTENSGNSGQMANKEDLLLSPRKFESAVEEMTSGLGESGSL